MTIPKLGSAPSQWLAFRRRRTSYWAAFITWVLFLAFLIADALADPAQWLIGRFFWLGIPIFFWAIISNYLLTYWHCPRCGKTYFRRSIWYAASAFTKRCVHCGLELWADPSAPLRGA